LGFRFSPEALALLNIGREAMTDETPVLGPVTVTLPPEAAAEVAMVLQHILHNVPDDPRPDQAARAHWLGTAAVLLSDGLVGAMKAAGLSDELIARASGRIIVSAPEADAAQLTLADDPQNPANEVPHLERAPDWAADAADDPVPDPNVVDFPTPGGPPDAA
jgi:hypothetical protein